MIILYGGFVDISGSKGDAVHAVELTSNLRRLGSRVLVVAHSSKPGARQDFFSAGAYGGTRGFAFRLLLFAISFLRAGRWILALSSACDVLYMRDYLFCALGIVAKVLYSKRIVWEVNGIACLERAQKPHPLNLLLLPIIGLLERLAAMSADRIVPVSKGIMDILLRRGGSGSKLVLLENGVNVEMFSVPVKASTIEEKKRNLGIPPSVPVVCYVGAIRPWQGLDVLITAAGEMKRRSWDVRFLVVGGGDGLDTLKKQAQTEGVDNLFVFTGAVDYLSVPLLTAVSDVCVAPFAAGRAASPIKVYEYMAAGKPMVVSRIAGLEFVEEKGLGRAVDPDDAASLAEAIISVLKDREGAGAMANKAQGYAVKNCSWVSVARKAEALCGELVDE